MDWQQAVQRADQIAAHGLHLAEWWDGRAIRGVLAVTLAGLAARQGCSVADVEIGSLLWHLDQGPSAVYELGEELGLAAEDGQPGNPAAEWAWLTRRWPSKPPLANSDGMPRGIGRGSSQPAIDVCTLWACAAARDALIAERPPGLPPRTRVRVIGGEDEGRAGEVVGPAWLMDDEHRTVLPGPPHGYEVDLTVQERNDGAQPAAITTLDGDVWLAALGPQGERVIVRAGDLEPENQ